MGGVSFPGVLSAGGSLVANRRLHRLFFIYTPTDVTSLWSKDHATSSAQVQKLYDWHIAQWSGFGTAVLTATVGFISAVGLETLKTPTIWDKRGTTALVAIGLASSIVLYALTQLRIQRLREVFRDLYSLMCNLKP